MKNAKAADRPYKLADGEGLFLLVEPNGSKLSYENGPQHLVPLSRQAAEIAVRMINDSKGNYLFPGVKPQKPLSENTMIYALSNYAAPTTASQSPKADTCPLHHP